MRFRRPRAHALPRALPPPGHPEFVVALEANLQHLAAALGESLKPGSALLLVEADSDPEAPEADQLLVYALDDNEVTTLWAKDGVGVRWQLGRDGILLVKNTTVSTIPRGTPLYLSGASDEVPAVAPAKADLPATMPVIGLALEELAADAFGRAMRYGVMEELDTSAFAAGDELYADASTAGALTATLPTGSAIVQKVGRVLASHASLGKILVDPQPASSIPAGLIAIWSGSIASIPSGWALCDGTNGTPDLTDKFIKGAASDVGTDPVVGATGGAKEHTHQDHPATATGTPSGTTEVEAGTGSTVASSSHTHDTPVLTHRNADGSELLTNHEPPFYALAFVMKT